MATIFVGNLSFQATEDDLRASFSLFGKVEGVNMPTDYYSGLPRGFGFVEMTDLKEARKAISELNGTQLYGRTLKVSEARPRATGAAGHGGFGGLRSRGA